MPNTCHRSQPAYTVLGFDYGQRRIGVAIGQTLTGHANALTTIDARNGEPNFRELDRIVTEWKPECFVVGLPTHLNGDESPLSRQARNFAELLEVRYRRPAVLWNEALSSEIARLDLARQREAGVRSRRLRRDDLDAHAACIILNGWLGESL